MRLVFSGPLGGLCLAAALCGCDRPAPSPPPPLELKELMAHVMDASADDFWSSSRSTVTAKGETTILPANDEAWERVENGAAGVVAATIAIKTPGYARSPIASWNAHADRVAAIALSGQGAARRRDTRSLAALSEQLDEACESCHREFDPATREGLGQLRKLMSDHGFPQ